MGLTAKERLKRTAYHEAGHAVVAYLLGRAFRYVSIEEGEDTLGRVMFQEPKGDFQLLEREIMMELGGPIAEKLLTQPKKWSDLLTKGHLHRAVEWASYLHGDSEVGVAYVSYLLARTKNLLSMTWAGVQALAEELLEHRRIGYRKAREIIKNGIRDAMMDGAPDHVKKSMAELEESSKKTKKKGR